MWDDQFVIESFLLQIKAQKQKKINITYKFSQLFFLPFHVLALHLIESAPHRQPHYSGQLLAEEDFEQLSPEVVG